MSTINLVGYAESFVFIILLAASMVALAVGIERAVIFNKNSNKKIDGFIMKLIELFRKNDMKSAGQLVKEAGDNVYTRFADFSMNRAGRNIEDLPEIMSGKIIEEKIFLEKRLTILNTLGNNAPFIGLLGTVLGVMRAFYGLGTLGNAGAEVVMRSISQALLATAAGLFIAIPVVMANNYFSKKIKIIMQHLEIFSKEINAGMRSSAGKENIKNNI